MVKKPVRPVVVKFITKKNRYETHGHANHAWKVAYADFVTAMMAFFLLLWLYSVTTPTQKMELSDYFTPSSGLKDGEGVGFKGGDRASPDAGQSRSRMTAPGLVAGQLRQGEVSAPPVVDIPAIDDPDADDSSVDPDAHPSNAVPSNDVDRYQFEAVTQQILQALEEDPFLEFFKHDILLQSTQEGLKIEIVDEADHSIFEKGRPVLTEHGKTLFTSMVALIGHTQNMLSITGHTSSVMAVRKEYDSWALSADRANAVRRFMLDTHMDPRRVMKIEGQADRNLLMPQEPANPRNNRVTITLMRGKYLHNTTSDAAPKKKPEPPPRKQYYMPSLRD